MPHYLKRYDVFNPSEVCPARYNPVAAVGSNAALH